MSVMSANNDSSIRLRESNQQQLQITSLSKLQTNSLDQLSNMYGKSKASDIAKSLVYGDKPKLKENKIKLSKQNTDQSVRISNDQQKTFVSTQSLKPSKYTVLSQQLFHHIPDTLDAHKSQRAFYTRDQNILLSPERLHSLPSQNMNATQVVPEVCNRLIEYRTFVSDKKKNLKEQLDNEYLSECSFQPQIDLKSRQMAVKNTNQEIRSADDFHEDQMKHQLRVLEKREQALKEQEEQEQQLLENPKLNPQSIKLAQKYSSQPLIDRLHERTSKSVQQTVVEANFSFRPEISKKSKLIKREESVQESLYKDAKNRLETRKLTETMVPESIIQPTDKSLSWFVQRFIKEFYYQLSSLERVQESKDYSKIYENDFQFILMGLGFGRSDQLWSLLNNGFYVLSRNLLVILLAIMAVPQHLIEIPLYKPKVEENVSVRSQFKIDENGNVLLSESDCVDLHKKFYNLYLNTKLQIGNGVRRQQARSPQTSIRCTSPKLSEKTKQLAESKKANLNLHDWFESQEIRKLERLEILKSQVLAEELKECKTIIRPITINLSDLAKPLQKQENRSAVDIEFESQAQHCTFQPQISQPAKLSDTNSYAANEIMKQAARMKEARVRQQTLQNLKQKGSTTNNKIRKNEKLKTEVHLNLEPKEKKQKSRPMFESVPLLFVDVKIDDAKTARIIVYDGDKSNVLAQQFATEHNLDESMKIKLKELLDIQINSLLTKIDEELDDES